ncbi:MAG: glycosyltransferase family 4 protein [Chitinophagaceae bacterium]
MNPAACRVLTIAPYKVLPPVSGGQLSIVLLADALGKLCENHVVGTEENASESKYSFLMHRVFPESRKRYVPRFGFQKILALARQYDVTHIICEHPYMAPLAIAVSRALKIPWLLRSQNIEAERFRQLGKPWWRLVRAFEEYAMRRADGILFITPEDCEFALQAYQLQAENCHLAPYGTSLKTAPGGHLEAKEKLAAELGLDKEIPWLYFVGAQHYAPNAEAVGNIIKEIAPRLMAVNFPCEILIAGKGLPQDLKDAIAASDPKITYLGFVENLDAFIKACDIMLNPLSSGGGIKTKAIEALAYNKIVLSTVQGAAGILPSVCGENLVITPDGDWDGFVAEILKAKDAMPTIPDAFFQRYNWAAIGKHVAGVLGSQNSKFKIKKAHRGN